MYLEFRQTSNSPSSSPLYMVKNWNRGVRDKKLWKSLVKAEREKERVSETERQTDTEEIYLQLM